jgi:cell division protein FtsI/penicillin-binding protein 2
MSAADWEDLKEEICTQLFLGKQNGEAELETIARIVWLERQKNLTLTISERLQQFYEAALEAVGKPVTSPVDRERFADSRKGKLLEWKTCSRPIGAFSSRHPQGADRSSQSSH